MVTNGSPRGLKADAHPAVREGLDGVVGERRAQQVAADPFDLGADL